MNYKERICAFIWNVSPGKLLWKGEGSGVGVGKEGRDRGGWEKGFRDSAYQIDESAVLALTPYFWLFLKGRVGRIEASSTFCLFNFLALLLQSHHRYLHAPGPRRHSVGGKSSVYSDCAGSTPAPFKLQESGNPHCQIPDDQNASLSRLETRLIRCVTLDCRAASLECKVLN